MKSIERCLAAAVVAFVVGGAARPAAAGERSFSVAVSGPATGRPMILIPGLMCPGEVWAEAAARYGATNRVHVLTLAGFAGSPPAAGDASLARVRDELIRYIRDERLDHPIIVGHSLGGFLAFWVAAAAPDLVGPIVSVDGVPFLPALMNPAATVTMMQPQADQMRTLFATMTGSQLAAQSRTSLPTMISDPANAERAAGWAAASDAGTVGRAMAEMFTTDLRPAVAHIEAPVLLVGAAKQAPDAGSLAQLTDAYRAQVATIRGASVVMAQHARHFVMMDDPQFLFAAIDRFLAAHPATARETR